MRKECVQMSLYDTYKDVSASMENDKPKLFRLLDKYIDWDSFIPARFYLAFYQNSGRPRTYLLVAFIKGLVLQKIFGYVKDSVLLVTLRHSREIRNFSFFRFTVSLEFWVTGVFFVVWMRNSSRRCEADMGNRAAFFCLIWRGVYSEGKRSASDNPICSRILAVAR